jgi:dienelactone hydrolase
VSFFPILLSAATLWGDLEAGPHLVGFEQLESFDYSRPFRAEGDDRARPITMSIWYPAAAQRDDEQPLRYGRYLDGADSRESFKARLATYGYSLSPAELEALFSSETGAVEKTPRASGPFPLLIFGTGLTGPFYLNTVLCEYLASHGYIVVAIPSLPAREDVEAAYDVLAVDAQIRDMEFVIQEMHGYPEVADGRFGLVAWSLGGVAQALLQMKNTDVGAVVSLDAATGYAYGEKLLESSIFFQPPRATAAFLHATDSRESGQVPKSFRYYDEVARGRSYLLTIEGATHAEFTSLANVVPLRVASLIGREGREGSEEALERYRRLSLYVRRFLDASLKSDSSAAEFLEDAPTRHGFDGLVLSRKR